MHVNLTYHNVSDHLAKPEHVKPGR